MDRITEVIVTYPQCDKKGNLTKVEALHFKDVDEAYKKLYKSGFIYQGIQPFPELKLLPNDPKNTFIIHDYLFGNIREENI